MARLASQFVALPPERRALAFAQTAARMSASSVMVEKDLWVCWLLGLLFADAELAPHLVFKGGTSLSKVYGVIDRFSEDIDLSMSPAFVGADETVFEGLKSRAQRDVALARMQSQCGERTRAFLMPRLEATIVEHLGRRRGPGHPGCATTTIPSQARPSCTSSTRRPKVAGSTICDAR
jgi:Nucleotidyl transferase AbiEii toxin, Type IV TA system